MYKKGNRFSVSASRAMPVVPSKILDAQYSNAAGMLF
jgi:hypothetical protein